MSKFEYKERATETYKQRTYTRDASKESFIKPGFKFFQPKDGNNKVRILPPTWDSPDHYGLDVYLHYKIGGANSSYLCLQKMKNKPCPICEALAKPEVKADKEFSDSIGIKKKVLTWVIDRSEENIGPKVWLMPTSLDRQFVMQSADEDTGEILRIDHPEHGYDISFDKTGKEIKTKYEGEKIARHQSALSSDSKLMDSWLDFISDNPIPDVLQYHDYDHIKAVFHGGVPEEEEQIRKAVEEELDTKSDRDEWVEKALEAGMSYKEVKDMTVDQIRDALSAPEKEPTPEKVEPSEKNFREAVKEKVASKYGK